MSHASLASHAVSSPSADAPTAPFPAPAAEHVPAPLTLVTATRGAGHYDVRTIAVGESPVVVTLRVGHDGVEYVGRLWFADPESEDRELADGIPDRAAVTGRTCAEVLSRVVNLRTEDLVRRHERAMGERRRFRGLRNATEEVLSRVRYLNRVALLVRDGLLDRAGGEQELDATEAQLHELVSRLRTEAGRES